MNILNYHKLIRLFAATCLGIFSTQASVELIFHEDFEDDGEGTRYTVLGGGSGASTAFFQRRQLGSAGTVAEGGTMTGDWMWGASRINAIPRDPLPPGTGLTSAEARITFEDIDISGYGDFRLEMAVAMGGGGQLSSNDFVIRARFDDGPWIEIGGFRSSSTNSSPRYYEGRRETVTTVDSPLLFSYFQDWSWDLVGSGSTMDLSITINSNANRRDYYFDNVRIYANSELSFFQATAEKQGSAENPLIEPESGSKENTMFLTFDEPTPAGGVTFVVNGNRETLDQIDFGGDTFFVEGGVTSASIPFSVIQSGRFTGRANIDIMLSAVGYNTELVRLVVENTTPRPKVLIMEVANGLPGTLPEDLIGDYNNDGVRQSAGDQFMEIVNFEDFPVDISGWIAGDDIGPRHVFAEGTILQPRQPMVIFGGGNPRGSFGGAIVITTSGGGNGWGFNGNSEEIAWINAPFGAEVQFVNMWDYATNWAKTSAGVPEGNPAHGETATQHRLTAEHDSEWEVHSLIPGSNYSFASPGTWPDGTPYYEVDNVITLSVDKESISEGDGDFAMTGTIDLFFPAPEGGVTITLTSDGLDRRSHLAGYIPQKITLDSRSIFIPEGESSVTFRIGAYNNGVLDGDRLVTINATRENYLPGSVTFLVTDVEPDTFNVVINEVMLDVVGTGSDLNMDGVFEDPVGDQYIEIVNASGRPVNLSGWHVNWITQDARGNLITSHVFPRGTWVPDQGAIVVFGRIAEDKARDPSFGGAIVQPALTAAGLPTINGLWFDPGRDQYLTLHNQYGYEVDRWEFLAALASQDMSINRDPDITGSADELNLHLDAALNLGYFNFYTPGNQLDGNPFPGNGEILLPQVFRGVVEGSNRGWFYDPHYGWLGVGTASGWDIPWVYVQNLNSYWYVEVESVTDRGMWIYEASRQFWFYTYTAGYPLVWNAATSGWVNIFD